MSVNTILLRRKAKMLVPAGTGRTSRTLIAAFNANIQSLGYSLSPRLIKALEQCHEGTALVLLDSALATLKEAKGVRSYRPMYPNFPKQVMEASECELYINALLHYMSFAMVDATGNLDAIWLPKYSKEKRAHLDEKFKVTIIDLASAKDVESLATAIATSNTSISPTDKADLKALFEDGFLKAPASIPNKENLAFVGALFLGKGVAFAELASQFRTATDVLRLATAISGGDVSLADDSKFRSFSRRERKLLLSALDKCGSLQEDMLRWKERWLRLGERLHPGEYAKRFKKAGKAFDALRNTKIRTIRTEIEALVRGGEVIKAATLLSTRPGDFARRLDHLLRSTSRKASQIRAIEMFLDVAPEVSTPVLLQVMTHFRNREGQRVIFPKGNVAKVMLLEKPLPPLPEALSARVADGIEKVLSKRFARLPKLGKVYIDPKLRECLVPFSQRSASKALRTLVRGSKLPFGKGKDTLRFFIWWKEPAGERTDLDLSAVMLDKEWQHVEELAYYNLRDGFGCHSGDITSAPNGASEFIDINIPKAIQHGGRYIVMTVHSFTQNHFCDLPECFAGWMLRQKPQSGEVYDPRTVADKVDLAMEATSGIPMIIDLVERKVIWADAAMQVRYGYNNARSSRGSIMALGKALTDVRKPDLHALLTLHAEARGKVVLTADKADVVFSVEAGTPFELEKIASEFLSDVKAKKAAAGKK